MMLSCSFIENNSCSLNGACNVLYNLLNYHYLFVISVNSINILNWFDILPNITSYIVSVLVAEQVDLVKHLSVLIQHLFNNLNTNKVPQTRHTNYI